MRFTSLISFFAIAGTFNVLASSKPLDSEDIICHGKDCYPKIFQATDDFQIVREDQIIPKGLHVRMDYHTGLKEAKLYDGHDDANLQAVEVFQDETIDPEPVYSPAEGHSILQSGAQQVLQPDKVDHGAIRPTLSGSDGVGFSRDIATITSASSESEAILPALENLEDLSHDIYWGLRLGQDGGVVHKLNVFIGNTSLDYQIRSAAALLLGTAVQNNPAALTAALSHFYNDAHPDGPLETVMLALIHEQIPALTVRLIYLISELCQDQEQLLRFIRGDGLAILRLLYDAQYQNPATTDRLRQKISNFILDHFLKEDSLQGLTKTTPGKLNRYQNVPLDEDSWTFIDKPDVPLASQTNDMLNARSSLGRWCEPFSITLAAWKKGSDNSESETAREHVLEASTALNAKLKSLGCSCEEVGVCQQATRGGN